jgi:hypothetical protein
MADPQDDDPEPSQVPRAPGYDVKLTLSDVTGPHERARRDLARLLRVFAGKQRPELATVLWQVAALFEAGNDVEGDPPAPSGPEPPAEL